MNIFIPQDVQFILNTIMSNGFDAYIVGGCVRDSILNRVPSDYDITTNAFPDDIISLFDKTIPTGIDHGTVTVLINKQPFEVTTFRTESDYLDNRHPSKVSFVTDINEDLSRRDFTINSIAYNDKNGLIDPFNGINDLKSKIVRCVGDSSLRFREDALRMLRAIRFSSQLDFEIDKHTLNAISENKDLLKNISIERIRNEFIKMLLSPKASIAMNHLINTETLKVILPDLYEALLDKKTLSNIDILPNKLCIRLCYTMIPLADFKLCERLLRYLRFDNNTINLTMRFYDAALKDFNFQNRISIKKLIYRISKDHIFDFLDLLKILYIDDFKLAKLVENVQFQVEDIIVNKEPLSIRDLVINGNDLKEFGIQDGKTIGKTLNFLLDEVLKNPELNTKDYLLMLAKQ